jgi:heparan-alpha-glucosaminide N-acetyltransferase
MATAITVTSPLPSASVDSSRVSSIDGYRGFVMFLMLAEVLHLGILKERFPGSRIAEWIHFHTEHVEWVGCSLHDMIQPSFSFLVGVSLAFSLAKRATQGQSYGKMALHAFGRSMILILLGIFLRSLGKPQTYFTFEDTLTQIGLGYFFLFLISIGPRWLHWLSVVIILVGYWAAFAIYPLPDASFKYSAVGVPDNWEHLRTGFEAHWNKNSNLAWAFDVWFLNLFPRESVFEFNRGGYATLSYIPTLATMLFGLIAGVWMKVQMTTRSRLARLFVTAIVCLTVGWALDYFGICPNVKRIWTPTFTLWSAGICFLILAAFHVVCDLAGYRAWLFPLIVIGSNSIAAYCMSWVLEAPIRMALLRHFGPTPFRVLDQKNADNYEVVSLEPLMLGVATLVILWLFLYWLYRQRIFIRI